MQRQKTSQLYDKNMAVAFYQDRYAHGYMDEWPVEEKRRIFEVISSFKLPAVGEALDFGCGNGVFTDVIKQALPPGWKVYGTDISAIAVENAQNRYPGCCFFVADDREYITKRFDFLFTHHVLEHVYNLPQVLKEVNDRMKDQSTMLHVLPCGNEGSFEHSVCMLKKDGINAQQENRFFFEDEGHVRRLTTEQLSRLFREKGFSLTKEYYNNQYDGAINWITRSGPSFLRLFTDIFPAIDEESRGKLKKIRFKLFLLWSLRYPAAFVESRLRKRRKTVRDYLFLIPGLLLYVFTKPMDNYLNEKASIEWKKRKNEHNGSEMYLFYKR